MTYRQVPPRWRLVAQLSTLASTSAIGVSIAYTPPKVDAKLTTIEQAMSVNIWAWIMIVSGLVGLICESFAAAYKSRNSSLLWIVSIAHIICLSVMLAYGLSAAISLVRSGHWYAFGGPVLALYIALMHFVFIKRKYTDPMEVPRLPRQDT